MNIALITAGYLPVVDGVSVAIDQRVRHLSRLGHRVLLLCPDYAPLQEIYPNWVDHVGEIAPGVRVVPLPSKPALGLNFERDLQPAAARQIQKELTAFAPDMIHVDEPERLTCCLWQRPGWAYAQVHRIPCVGFFHTHYIDYLEDYLALPPPFIRIIQCALGRLFAWIYNGYDATLVASPITEQYLQRMGIRNTRQGRFLGVDLHQFSPTLRQPHFFEQHYGLATLDQRIKLVFVGRLTPDKGWAFTYRALLALKQRIDPDAIALLVVGEGPLRAEINAQLRRVTPHVHCFGRVAVKDMPRLLANSDIHVTTSEKETTGLTILEASAVGIPVVAPAAGGVVDHIDIGQNGVLYRPSDLEDFVAKLLPLVESAEHRQSLGKCARQFVEIYDWQHTVAALLRVWDEARGHRCH